MFRARPCSVIRKGKWKLTQYFESGDLELYDLSNDLAESTNVASSNLAVVDELFLALENWQTQTNAAIPRTPNPKFDEAQEKAAIEKKRAQAIRQKRGLQKQ